MKKPGYPAIFLALILALGVLSGCGERPAPPSGTESAPGPGDTGEESPGADARPLTFSTLTELEAAVRDAAGGAEEGEHGLADILYYYLPINFMEPDFFSAVFVTGRSVTVEYQYFWQNPAGESTLAQQEFGRFYRTIRLEWTRDGDGPRLLEDAASTLELQTHSPGLYCADLRDSSGVVMARRFYWAADGHLFTLQLPLRYADSENGAEYFTALEKRILSPRAADWTPRDNVTLPPVGVDLENPSEGLRALAEIAKGYALPAYFEPEFLYNNRMFRDYAGGRGLTPGEFEAFRDSLASAGEAAPPSYVYIRDTVLNQDGVYMHPDADGLYALPTFAWGPVFADLNGDGSAEICFLLHNHTGSEFARFVAYEKVGGVYGEKLHMWTGRDTFYVVENDGFLCLASAGPDYGRLDPDTVENLYETVEIRLLAFRRDWSAQGLLISDGALKPPSDPTFFESLIREGHFERALRSP